MMDKLTEAVEIYQDAINRQQRIEKPEHKLQVLTFNYLLRRDGDVIII